MPVIKRLGMDVLLWYFVPSLFMLVYVGYYSKPPSAVAPHFLVVGLLLLLLLLVRLLISRWIASAKLRLLLAGVVTSSAMALLLIYYGLVLIGLHSWGGVVTWSVIPIFFAQLPVAADALGIPAILAPVTLVIAYLGLIMACSYYFERFDWTNAWVGTVSGGAFTAIVSCAMAILVIGIYQFATTPWAMVSEPISLTFSPHAVALDLEGYSVNPVTATREDRAQDAARRVYAPAVVNRA